MTKRYDAISIMDREELGATEKDERLVDAASLDEVATAFTSSDEECLINTQDVVEPSGESRLPYIPDDPPEAVEDREGKVPAKHVLNDMRRFRTHPSLEQIVAEFLKRWGLRIAVKFWPSLRVLPAAYVLRSYRRFDESEWDFIRRVYRNNLGNFFRPERSVSTREDYKRGSDNHIVHIKLAGCSYPKGQDLPEALLHPNVVKPKQVKSAKQPKPSPNKSAKASKTPAKKRGNIKLVMADRPS